MARTPYSDPDAEDAYQSMASSSSKPSGDVASNDERLPPVNWNDDKTTPMVPMPGPRVLRPGATKTGRNLPPVK